MTFHPKLVRDKIPKVIRESGKECSYRKLDPDEYPAHLCKKMREELLEFEETPNLEEAADIYEVFLAMLSHWKLSVSDVTATAQSKSRTRGGFFEGVFLESVEE